MEKFTVERELKDLTNEELLRIYDFEPFASARRPVIREEVFARMNKPALYYGNQMGQQQFIPTMWQGKQ